MPTLDSAAALFVYLIGVRLKGRVAGVAAGLIYAVTPAAIVYSRRIWNPDFVPFFAAIALYALVTFWQTRRSGWLAAALFCIACAAQLHLVAGVFLLLWLLVFLLRLRDVRWQPLAISLAALALLLSPYIYLQTQSGWSDLSGLLSFLGQPKQTDVVAIDTALTLVGADFYHGLLQPPAQTSRLFSHDLFTWLLGLLALAGLLRTVIVGQASPPVVERSSTADLRGLAEPSVQEGRGRLPHGWTARGDCLLIAAWAAAAGVVFHSPEYGG